MAVFEDNELEIAIATYNRIPEAVNYRHKVLSTVYCEFVCDYLYDKK